MISLVIFLNDNDHAKTFFKNLHILLKKVQDQEIVFIVNKQNYFLDEIKKCMSLFPNAIIKFIYSYKSNDFNKLICAASELITNEYVLITTSNSTIDSLLYEDLFKTLDDDPVDILEFKPSIEEFWNPVNRLNKSLINKEIKIKKNPEVIAFSFPFIFNKIISLNLLKETLSDFICNSKSKGSTFFLNSLTYLIFINASSYKYVQNIYLKYNFNVDETMIEKYCSQIWNELQDVYLRGANEYLDEIKYAKWFYYNLILTSMNVMLVKNEKSSLFHNNNNNVLNKLMDKLNNLKEKEFNHFELENKYMISDFSPIERKLLKEIHPITKWKKMLRDLE